MKETAVFSNMPADHRGYSSQTKVSCTGNKMVKTTTMTVNMPDGSKKILEQTEERTMQ